MFEQQLKKERIISRLLFVLKDVSLAFGKRALLP